MKLYLFRIGGYGKPKLNMEEFEVEEKPKTYVNRWRRFSKELVGIASGNDYCFDECLLLENNPPKAARILLPHREYELKQLEERVANKKLEIKMLKNYINED